MDGFASEPLSRPRTYLGSVTLLLALTLSVRVLDAAYTLPAFRPMVAHAAVRLLAVSNCEQQDRRPAPREGNCVSAKLRLAERPEPVGSSLVDGPVWAVRSELVNLPPPACVCA